MSACPSAPPDASLSPDGIRALSKFHQDHPYVFHVGGQEHRVELIQLFGLLDAKKLLEAGKEAAFAHGKPESVSRITEHIP